MINDIEYYHMMSSYYEERFYHYIGWHKRFGNKYNKWSLNIARDMWNKQNKYCQILLEMNG